MACAVHSEADTEPYFQSEIPQQKAADDQICSIYDLIWKQTAKRWKQFTFEDSLTFPVFTLLKSV